VEEGRIGMSGGHDSRKFDDIPLVRFHHDWSFFDAPSSFLYE